MDREELFKGEYDLQGVIRGDDRDSEFNVLRERIQKLKKEITSVSQCFNYVLGEISSENEKISQSLKWNEKRLNLLSEISVKIKNMNDKLNLMYEEMFSIVENNFKTQK